jgi:membrane protease YdiL (CAAX protease family)
MNPQRRTITVVGAALFLLGLFAAGTRVLVHERGEADRRSEFQKVEAEPATATGTRARVLLAMPLEQGESVDFEVCVQDRARAAAQATDARVAVWPLDEGAGGAAEPLIEASLDETLRDDAAIARVDGASCLRFASAPALGASGRFALGVRWSGDAPSPALRALPLAGRIVVRRGLVGADRGALALLGAGALTLLIGLALRRRAETPPVRPMAAISDDGANRTNDENGILEVGISGHPMLPEHANPDLPKSANTDLSESVNTSLPTAAVPTQPTMGNPILDATSNPTLARGSIPRVVDGLVMLGGMLLVPVAIPLDGATLPFAFAALLAAWQVLLAFRGISLAARAGRSRIDTLGLSARSRRAVIGLVAAPVIGVALFVIGGVVQGLVARLGPSETVSAMERFVSWPSATLAVAAVALISPIAEETFFRGFVFGELEGRLGPLLAGVLTTIAFVLPHLPQLWGAWGAIAALTVTSIALTGLRATTGSTLAPALAHLASNALIAAGAAM